MSRPEDEDRGSGPTPRLPHEDPPEDLDIREEWGSRTVAPETRGSARPDRIRAETERRVTADVLPKRRVRGVARSVETRADQKLTFRVDRYDVAGNRLTPVGVEMRYQRSGLITDGDEVEVVGRWTRGTLRASRVVNLTSTSEVRTWFPGWAKWMLILLLLVAIAIAALRLPGVFSAGSAFGTSLPSVVGQEEAVALAALRELGLSPQVVTEASETVPTGQVIRTEPPAGFAVPRDIPVVVVVSSGSAFAETSLPSAPLDMPPASVTVSTVSASVIIPSVEGLSESDALAALSEIGLSPTSVTEESDSVPSGYVIRTDPPTQTSVEPESEVTVVVSSGPAEVTAEPESVVLPEVTGDSQEVATQKLSDLGLSVTYEVETNPDVPAGLVIRSDPIAGTSVPLGTTVILIVSTGP